MDMGENGDGTHGQASSIFIKQTSLQGKILVLLFFFKHLLLQYKQNWNLVNLRTEKPSASKYQQFVPFSFFFLFQLNSHGPFYILKKTYKTKLTPSTIFSHKLLAKGVSSFCFLISSSQEKEGMYTKT
jgi:hypothetical protein